MNLNQYFRPSLLSLLSGVAVASVTSGAEIDVASLSLAELMEVEVTTPGKVPEAIRDTPASVYLVSRDDVETFGYSSLTEIFENVPGFYNVDNYRGVSGNFGVRGYWNARSQNSNVAILVNGIPQTRPDLFATPMEGINVPVEAIDRIEVSRGPNSVIYGNGAFFGAINIITDDSYTDDLLTVSTGSNGSHRVALRFSEFGEDFHVILNAGLSETDGYDYDLLDLVGSDRIGFLPMFGVEEGNTSLDGRLEQQSGYLQLSTVWNNVSLDYSVNDSTVEGFSGYPSVAGGNARDSLISRISLGTEFSFGEYVLDTNLSYQSYDSEEDYDALSLGFEGINTREFDNWELETLLSYDAKGRIRYVAGLNLQRMQNFFEYTHVPEVGLVNESVVVDKRDLRSVFGQLNYEISDTWDLVAGYRIEEMGGFNRFVFEDEPIDGTPLPGGPKGGFDNGTPRVSLIYQPDDAHVFKMMIGDAIKIPNFNDPTFNSEHLRTVEANYTWTTESVLFSASVFRNSLDELLIQTLDLLPNGAIDTDLLRGGEVITSGIEVLARSSFSDAVRGELGFTLQESDDEQTPNNVLSYSPKLVAHGKVSYKKGNFTGSALARYVGDMRSFYNLDANASPLLASGYFGEDAGDYFVTDLNLRWDNVWEDVYLNLHLTNVFDEEIRYPNNPINGFLLTRGNLGHGRRFSVSAGVKF